MPKRNKTFGCQEAPELIRIQLDQILTEFTKDPTMEEYTFPNNLGNHERKYVHERVRKFGLKSRSHGKEPNRVLSIYRKSHVVQEKNRDLLLTRESNDALRFFFNKYPSIRQELVAVTPESWKVNFESDSYYGRLPLMTRNKVLVPATKPNQLTAFRMSLPIQVVKESFLQLLDSNQIIIITAETGSGKTTQIPQFILEEATNRNERCRIVCTQPRRISAVSVAERVAAERGEICGDIVGYQIKLESRMGPQTALIYCTNGVLLRTLMLSDERLLEISHIIIDEIHERDKFSDFLLICLKQCVTLYPHLKVVLMSATMDIRLFESYFPNSQIINIPGRLFPITELLLEETLQLIDFSSSGMKSVQRGREQFKNPHEEQITPDKQVCNSLEVDETLINCISNGNDDSFDQLLQFILCEGVSVNYREATFGYTPLIAAAHHGRDNLIEQLLNMGT